jgi:hypothetical protein
LLAIIAARFGVGNAFTVLNFVLIEPYRVDAFRQEAAAVGVDQPEHAIALADSKESCRPELAVGNAAPSGFGHLHRHRRTELNLPLVCHHRRTPCAIC